MATATTGASANVNPSAVVAAPTSTVAAQACAHCGLPVSAGVLRAQARPAQAGKPPTGRQARVGRDASPRESATTSEVATSSASTAATAAEPTATEDAPLPFCCAGCETVYYALRDSGLCDWYSLAADDRAPARTSGRSYAEFDDPAFSKLYVTAHGALAKIALYAEDLRCAACIWLVEEAPKRLPGVRDVRADLSRSRIDVVFDPAQVELSAIARQLDRVGHVVHPYRGIDRDEARRREDRSFLIKLGVAGAVVGNVMLLAIALYAGWLEDMSVEDTVFFRWTSMLATVPATLYTATPFFRGAWLALRQRRLHLDLPLSFGLLAGLIWGTANTIRNTGEIYFDTLSMLVFLLLAARWVQGRQHRRASTTAEMLLALTASRARRVAANAANAAALDAAAEPSQLPFSEVPIDAVAIGDVLLVLAGENIPVDGEVVAGSSALDLSLLTGESRPAGVQPGAQVFAGTTNVAAPLLVRAQTLGETTRVGKIVAMIDEQRQRRSQVEQLIDSLSGRFVVAVCVAAGLTFVGWGYFRSWALGAEHAMALLIVTCPCALALATPLAVSVSLGRAARRGILIKGADALERVAQTATVLLDKTGTLTEGKLSVQGYWPHDRDAALVAALEQTSSHPIAQALAAYRAPDATPATHAARDAAANTANTSASSAANVAHTVTAVETLVGRGITGIVDGVKLRVGSPSWLGSEFSLDPAWQAQLADWTRRGATPVWIVRDGVLSSMCWLQDSLGRDSADAVGQLRGLGYAPHIVSGDDPAVVTAIGTTLGLAPAACQGGVTPEQKLAEVHRLRASGQRVLMVGDGVNDAAALAAADCGVAVHGSADSAIEAADIYVRADDLMPVVELIDGARATLATIRRNLHISTFYNVVSGGLAVAGVIHPLWAAILMPLSSLTVLVSSQASRAFVPGAHQSSGPTPEQRPSEPAPGTHSELAC